MKKADKENLKTWPKKIYLQAGDDYELSPYTNNLEGDVTWCADKIDSFDVEYIRADLVKKGV